MRPLEFILFKAMSLSKPSCFTRIHGHKLLQKKACKDLGLSLRKHFKLNAESKINGWVDKYKHKTKTAALLVKIKIHRIEWRVCWEVSFHPRFIDLHSLFTDGVSLHLGYWKALGVNEPRRCKFNERDKQNCSFRLYINI